MVVAAMTYEIVFEEKPPGERAVIDRRRGEGRVFLSNPPTNPKVFVFFYRGSAYTSEVEQKLSALGKRTGDNLYVNIGSQADPHYKTARNRFGIRQWPVIVVTAISPLAASPEGDTAFVRLDNKSLFEKPEELVRTVEKLFNLFLGEEIKRAVWTGWTEEGKAALLAAAERIWSVIQPLVDWVAERDVTVQFAGMKIEMRRH
jgi:hypothetical protein